MIFSFRFYRRSISLHPPQYLEPCLSLHRNTTHIYSKFPSLLFLLRLPSVPLPFAKLGGRQILNICRFVQDLYGTASSDSFLHAQRAESQGDPHRTWVSVWPGSARSADTLSLRENGSLSRSQVRKALDECFRWSNRPYA
jgi:hypothetical protein